MELSKFLSLCGMLIGFIAAVFLSRVLLQSPDQILRGTFSYSPMGWPSVAIISDKAGQKADTLASMILVFLALGLQLCAVFANSWVQFASALGKATGIAIAFVVIVGVVVYHVRCGVQTKYEMEIKKLAARDYVKSAVEGMGVSLYADSEAIANQYFGLKPRPEEKPPDFVKRLATFVGYEVPKNADFSKFQ